MLSVKINFQYDNSNTHPPMDKRQPQSGKAHSPAPVLSVPSRK